MCARCVKIGLFSVLVLFEIVVSNLQTNCEITKIFLIILVVGDDILSLSRACLSCDFSCLDGVLEHF